MRILFNKWIVFLVLLAGLCACWDQDLFPGPYDESEFIRFTPGERPAGLLETAVVTYTNPDGRKVDLIAAVHLGDAEYFDHLEKLFTEYDALLYEMIAPSDTSLHARKDENDSPVSFFQRAMCNALGLEFQLDAIDYGADNFVHADLTIREFAKLWEERGESLLGMIFKIFGAQLKAMEDGLISELTPATIVEAFASEDSASQLKFLMAKEFKNIEQLLACLETAEDGEESLLLGERNKAAIKVLKKQLRKGKKKLGLFYGAGHMQDLELRLQRDLGFTLENHRWLPAWKFPRDQEPPEETEAE